MVGLGGVGKSQIAVEYVSQYATGYSVIFWITADNEATITAGYLRLGTSLGIDINSEAQRTNLLPTVQELLMQRGRYLLVFDNAANDEQLEPYLPSRGPGAIIITSRNPNWARIASPLVVGVLPPDSARRFLQRRSQQTDDGKLDELVSALGALPLALEQAGAYMEATKRTFGAYLDLFERRHAELMQLGGPPLDYPHTVWTTWNLSMDEVRKKSIAADALLSLCAFMAADDIPIGVIRDGAKFLPAQLRGGVEDDLAWDETISKARAFSLLDLINDAIAMHRLVQLVTRERLPPDDVFTWVDSAVKIVNRAFPFDSDDVQTWSACARLLPHAESVTRFAEGSFAAPTDTGMLLNQIGLYFLGGLGDLLRLWRFCDEHWPST